MIEILETLFKITLKHTLSYCRTDMGYFLLLPIKFSLSSMIIDFLVG